MVLLFVAIVWWVYKKDRQDVYSQIEQIPFDEESEG